MGKPKAKQSIFIGIRLGVGFSFNCLVLVLLISENGATVAAPTHAEAGQRNTAELMIEDDKAFWDAKPFNESDNFAVNESVIQPVHSNESIHSRIPGSCKMSPLEFDCGNGICIPIKKWRDCHPDCPGGIDEECWVNQIRCDGCKCVDPDDEETMCRRH